MVPPTGVAWATRRATSQLGAERAPHESFADHLTNEQDAAEAPPSDAWIADVFDDEGKSGDILAGLHELSEETSGLFDGGITASQERTAEKAQEPLVQAQSDIAQQARAKYEHLTQQVADLKKFADESHDSWREQLHDIRADMHASEAEAKSELARPVYLDRVNVPGVIGGRPGHFDIFLPDAWLDRFAPGSIRVQRGQHEGIIVGVGTARLAADPSRKVRFTAMETGSAETTRELYMAELLHDTGIVPVLLDSVEFDGVTYLLTEAYTNDLDTLIEAQLLPDNAEKGSHMQMAPGKAMPIMAALLRSLITLEEAGVVHGALSESRIVFADQGSRPLLTQFRVSCMEDASGDAVSCEVRDEEVIGSAFRQPPELQGEHLGDTAASNVWQLGLVFARMMFGGRVATYQATKDLFPGGYNDRNGAGRKHIREQIRSEFSLSLMPGYTRLRSRPLHAELLDIVEGMLLADPEKRWSASMALESLEAAAQRAGVPLDMEKDPKTSVEEWMRAWQ